MRFIAMTAVSASILASALAPLSPVRAETLLPPSPEWAQAMPGAPVAGSRLTPEYVKQVGHIAKNPVVTRQLQQVIDGVCETVH